MSKTMSQFLEKPVLGNIRVRTILILLLCVANFGLAYGIALYVMLGGGSALLIICAIITVALMLIVAFPNLETQDDKEATDAID